MSVETLKNNEYSTEEGLFNLKKEINETINSTPEMNENEIKQLTGSQLHDIFLQSEWKTYKDNNWEYIIVNLKNQKRKLYYTLGKPLKDGHTYISVDSVDNYNICIWRKVWDKIVWVYANIENNNAKNIYKWNLTYKNGELQPKK